MSQVAIKREGAFTLIELLIVVAIIAILAAIAIPNFLEAQVRAKVAREKSDIRTQALGEESYFVDNNTYTRDMEASADVIGQVTGKAYTEYANGVVQLTTPIAYISSILSDPFASQVGAVGAGMGAIGYRVGSGTWSYGASTGVGGFNDDQGAFDIFKNIGKVSCYVILAIGPDGTRCRCAYKAFPYAPAAGKSSGKEDPVGVQLNTANSNQPNSYVEYDPTNGTSSVGDVYRFGGSYTEGRYMLNGGVVGGATAPASLTGIAW